MPHGSSAANALGLTQQVPIREVYLTSGRTRKLKLGHSEVLEGTAPWIAAVARVLPLSLTLDAARAVMLDGEGLLQVTPEFVALAAMTAAFLLTGAALFRWRVD